MKEKDKITTVKGIHKTVLAYPKWKHTSLNHNKFDNMDQIPDTYMVVGMWPDPTEYTLHDILMLDYKIKRRNEDGVLLLVCDKVEEENKEITAAEYFGSLGKELHIP